MSMNSSIGTPARWLLALGFVFVLFALSVPQASGASKSSSRFCAGAILTPQGKISLIWGQQVSCRLARKVSRPARQINIYSGPYRYRTRGFRCVGSFDDTFTDHVTWKCKKGPRKKVSFYQT